MSLQPRKSIQHDINTARLQYIIHTSFVFNKRAHFFRMVNVAVVQHEDASRTRVRVRKGDL
jgi:hypothetical protein